LVFKVGLFWKRRRGRHAHREERRDERCAAMAALLASSCALSSSLTLLASSPSFTSSARLPSSSRSVSGVGVFVVAAPAAASSSAVKVGIRCQIAAANADDEEASSSSSVKRRDIFVALGASTIAAGVWSLSPMTPEANAADLIQRQQRSKFLTSVKEKLQAAVKASPELVPDLLRLSLNDALTYDKGSKTGGANGSVRTELSRPENQGLEKALNVLQDLKKEIDEGAKGGPITWSDLIHIGAQSACKRTFIDSAIRKCGGNEQKGLQLYGAYGSNGQVEHHSSPFWLGQRFCILKSCTWVYNFWIPFCLFNGMNFRSI
jgi:hypothetical protein